MTLEHAYLLSLLIGGAAIAIAPSYWVVVIVRPDESLVVLTNRAILEYSSFHALSHAGPTRQISLYDGDSDDENPATLN